MIIVTSLIHYYLLRRDQVIMLISCTKNCISSVLFVTLPLEAQVPSTWCMKLGVQYSVSAACRSTQTRESASRSSMMAPALAFSQPKLSRRTDIVTYPKTCMTSRTVDWSVLSSFGTDRIIWLAPRSMILKPDPNGSNALTARRISSLKCALTRPL